MDKYVDKAEKQLRFEINCPWIGAEDKKSWAGTCFLVLLQRTHLQNYWTFKTICKTRQNNRDQDDPPHPKITKKEGKIFLETNDSQDTGH